MQCPQCEFKAVNLNGLSTHCKKKHTLIGKELYDIMFPTVESVLCECGCGKKTSFISVCQGYATYLKGHGQRKPRTSSDPAPLCACGCGVTTRWHVRKQAYLEYIHGHNARGKPSPFKGFNKLTHDKFKQQSETIMADEEECLERSRRLTQLHRDDKIPHGPDHHNWKGGTTKLGEFIRGHRGLFKKWRLPKLIAANRHCQKCFKVAILYVHHDGESMASIVALHLAGRNADELSHEEKLQITHDIIDYHVNNNVSGIVLCETCHYIEHYGQSNKGNS